MYQLHLWWVRWKQRGWIIIQSIICYRFVSLDQYVKICFHFNIRVYSLIVSWRPRGWMLLHALYHYMLNGAFASLLALRSSLAFCVCMAGIKFRNVEYIPMKVQLCTKLLFNCEVQPQQVRAVTVTLVRTNVKPGKICSKLLWVWFKVCTFWLWQIRGFKYM